MLKISDFSKLSRISIRMLRFYDEKDILKPSIVNGHGYRYYTAQQLKTASQIRYLRYLGFSTRKIKTILHHYQNHHEIAYYLEQRLENLKTEQIKINEQIIVLTKTIQKLKQEEVIMNYQVEIKNIPSKYMMCKRGVIPSYDREDLLWKGLYNELKERQINIEFVENGTMLAIFHDKGYKEKDVDVEIRTEVNRLYDNTDHIYFQKTQPIKVASITFTGSYEHISEVSYTIADWISKNEYKLCGPNFTIYHVGYAQTKNVEEFVTEVCYPIE